MEWILPIIALVIGGIIIAISAARNAKYSECENCPFANECPTKNPNLRKSENK